MKARPRPGVNWELAEPGNTEAEIEDWDQGHQIQLRVLQKLSLSLLRLESRHVVGASYTYKRIPRDPPHPHIVSRTYYEL